MEIEFSLKEEIGEMAHIMNKNFDIFKDKLKNSLLNYSKEEIVKWVVASLAIPKNHVISYRFLTIQQILMSLPEEQFKGKRLDVEKMEEILILTKKLNWSFAEDWIPWKEFKFNFEGKLYRILPGSLENPLELLDILVRRILPLESFLKEKIGYSIKEELVKILNFQDKVSLNLPNESSNEEVPWVIPSKESIDTIFNICSEYSPSKQLFKNKEKFEEPKDPAEADSLFSDYPVCKEIFINMPNLIHLFYRRLLADIKKNTTKELEKELDNQSDWEIVRAITECVPIQAIIKNFSIEGINQIFDKGFQYENKFFMFNIIREHLSSKEILDEIKNIQNNSKKLIDVFNKGNASLNLDKKRISIDSNTKPFQIIIYDGLNGSKISSMNKEILVLDYYALNYLFEDLFDMGSSPIYLAKAINKFREANILTSPYTTFLDFYDSTKYGTYLFSLFKSAIMALDPHMHSGIMERRQAKRPMWHNQPKSYPQRGSFKLIREGKHSLHGYNAFLQEDFRCIDKLNLYIHRKMEGMDQKTYMVSTVISGIIQFYLEELLEKDMIGLMNIQEKVINVCSCDHLPEELKEKLKGNSIEILSDGKEIFLFFNENIFFEEFIRDPISLACFFEARLLRGIFGPKKFKELEETLLGIDLRQYFQMGQYDSTQKPEDLGRPTFPDNLDNLDTELLLLKELEKSNITSGTYGADKARSILMDLYSNLEAIISKELSLLDLNEFSKFAYGEIEKIIGARENSSNQFRLSKETLNEKRYFEEIVPEEMKNSVYGTASRFLLEKAITFGSDGVEKIDSERWQKLLSLGSRLMSISSVLEYLRKPLYEFIKIQLKIDLEERISFDIIIEDNPIENHISNIVKNTSKLDNKRTQEPNDSIKSLYSAFSEMGGSKFQEINKFLEKYFGFKCEDYLIVLNVLTNYPSVGGLWGVCEANKQEIIEFIINFLDGKKDSSLLENEKISKIIDFSTISFQKNLVEMFPSEGTMQENRLMVRPLANLGRHFVFAPGMIKVASENFLNGIIVGKWVYSKTDDLPEELFAALSAKHAEISKRLEDDLLDELKKITPYYKGNIKEFRKGKNSKCFANIKEELPGEIDALSLHLENKKIIIWEAKDVTQKFGAKEVSNLITDKFIGRNNNGYLTKAAKKQKFVQRNISEILRYYKIGDIEGWTVDYSFVFYSRSLVMSFLEKKGNFITLDEVKKFIEC